MDLTYVVLALMIFVILGIVAAIARYVLSRGLKTERVIAVSKDGSEWELKKLSNDGGGMYVDKLNNEYYPYGEGTIWIKSKIKPGKYKLFHEETGVSLIPKVSREVYELGVNPKLLSRVVDSYILQQAFRLKPSIKAILAAFAFGVILGLMFGIPIH